MRKLMRKVREKKGQSLVEYALILALVAIVVIAALTTLGATAGNTFDDVASNIAAA